MEAPDPDLLSEETAWARMAHAQLAAVQAASRQADGSERHPRLLEQYGYRLGVMQRVSQTEGGLPKERARHFDVIVAAVTAGRMELLRLHRAGIVHDSVLRVLEAELDLEELTALRRRGRPGRVTRPAFDPRLARPKLSLHCSRDVW